MNQFMQSIAYTKKLACYNKKNVIISCTFSSNSI